MGWLGKLVGGVAKGLPGIGNAISIGSSVLGAVAGSKRGAKADDMRQRQIQYADERFKAGAPFRQRLADLAARPTAMRPDMSALVADPGNPYARTAPRPSFRPEPMAGPSLAQQAFPEPTPDPRLQKAQALASRMAGRGGMFR